MGHSHPCPFQVPRPTLFDIYPIIHLAVLDMLPLDGAYHESVKLVEHLIVSPRCGLRLRRNGAHVGFDQRKLCAIIDKI